MFVFRCAFFQIWFLVQWRAHPFWLKSGHLCTWKSKRHTTATLLLPLVGLKIRLYRIQPNFRWTLNHYSSVSPLEMVHHICQYITQNNLLIGIPVSATKELILWTAELPFYGACCLQNDGDCDGLTPRITCGRSLPNQARSRSFRWDSFEPKDVNSLHGGCAYHLRLKNGCQWFGVLLFEMICSKIVRFTVSFTHKLQISQPTWHSETITPEFRSQQTSSMVHVHCWIRGLDLGPSTGRRGVISALLNSQRDWSEIPSYVCSDFILNKKQRLTALQRDTMSLSWPPVASLPSIQVCSAGLCKLTHSSCIVVGSHTYFANTWE